MGAHVRDHRGSRATTHHRSGRHTAAAVIALVATALALIAALVPAAPASAAPAPSTLTLQVVTDDSTAISLSAVVSAGSVVATGVVVFSEGGTELGRATLIGGRATFVTELTVTGSHSYAASYLGSPEVAPSSASSPATYDSLPFPSQTMTGSLSIGARTLAIGPTNHFKGLGGYVNYDPITGAFTTAGYPSAFVDLAVTGDVPGTGPVTLALRPRWQDLTGTTLPDGSVSLAATGVSLVVERVLVDGVTWGGGPDCVLPIEPITLRGTSGAGGLAVTGAAAAPTALAAAACDGRGALVNGLLSGPISMDLLLDGKYPPPVYDVPTTTTLIVSPQVIVTGERITLQATTAAAGGRPSKGTVEFRDNGELLGTAPLSGQSSVLGAFVNTTGPHSFSATYLGQTHQGNTVRQPSTGTVDVDVQGPPAGRAASGGFTLSGQPTVSFGPDTLLTGGGFDPATGAIDASTFWIPGGQFRAAIGFDVGIGYRLTQLTPMTGQVATDGTVAFTPATFRLEGLYYQIGVSASWYPLGGCDFAPITLSLTGTADATGLHLRAPRTRIPATTGYCAGWRSYVNPVFTAGADFVFDVAGDFRRDDATPVQVVSWYPTVDQHNQTHLSAAVTPTDGADPTGDVTFRDGNTVLGVVPLDPTGHAHLTVALDRPGARTITADYHGNRNPGWAATGLEVTPAPTGYAMDGHLTIGTTTLPIAPGSQLLPATPPAAASGADPHGAVTDGLTRSTASLWFMPTNITTDLPGYGPVTAEVRLNQHGSLSPATIGAGGTVDGLTGMFVLQVRSITTVAGGTETPLGCVNLVLLGFDGRLSFTDVGLTTPNAGIGRIPWGSCTGAAQALAEHLTGTPTTTIHAVF